MELPTAHSLNVSWSIFTNVNWEFQSIVHDDKTSYPVYIIHSLPLIYNKGPAEVQVHARIKFLERTYAIC